ncbi:MAG: hypothetical protein V1873_00395 [Verrucomicrobiota bacterium]
MRRKEWGNGGILLRQGYAGQVGEWENGGRPFAHSPILLLLLFLLAAGCRRAEPPPAPPTPEGPLGLTASLSTNVVRVGDVFRLTLTASQPAGSRLVMPELAGGKEVVVRNQQMKTGKPSGGLETITVTYDLASFVVGQHTVSSGEVQCVAADGRAIQQRFPVVSFQVQTTLTGTNAVLRESKGLVRWPGAFPRWVVGMILVATLALVAGLLVARFLRKPRTILQYPPPPPPHEVARRALRTLLAKGWIGAGNLDPFYVELSGIIRTYLENRFGLRAPERTTEEFIREAASSRLLVPEHQLLARDFLEQCDLVKFARHRPAQAEMRAAYDSAERLVNETIPQPEAATVPGEPS